MIPCFGSSLIYKVLLSLQQPDRGSGSLGEGIGSAALKPINAIYLGFTLPYRLEERLH
jgi:hypothetical protein